MTSRHPAHPPIESASSGSKIPGFSVSWKSIETSPVREVDEGNWKHHLFHPNQRIVSFLLTASLVTEVLKERATLGTSLGTILDVFLNIYVADFSKVLLKSA